jgi:hypothetical protein
MSQKEHFSVAFDSLFQKESDGTIRRARCGPKKKKLHPAEWWQHLVHEAGEVRPCGSAVKPTPDHIACIFCKEQLWNLVLVCFLLVCIHACVALVLCNSFRVNLDIWACLLVKLILQVTRRSRHYLPHYAVGHASTAHDWLPPRCGEKKI